MNTRQKPPSALLIDLDDTIVSAYGQPLRVWTKVAQEFSSTLAPVDPLEVAYAIGASAEEFWACPVRHKEWRGNLIEARRKIAAGALAQFPSAVPFADAIADRFSAIREEEMHLFPGAHDALRRLKGLRIKLALITNGTGAVQRAKLARFDLAQYFDHIQIESELGFGKPDERAYTHAVEASTDTVWIAGDNLEWEVAAPQRLGIFSVWLDAYGAGLPAGSPVRPYWIIGSLSGLADLLAPDQ